MQKLIEFTSKTWNTYAIIIKYKRAKFKILFKSLSDFNQRQLIDHVSSEFNINGFCSLSKGEIVLDSIFFNFNNYGIPIRLVDHKIKETKFTTYEYQKITGTKTLAVQTNGFLVYCAPTGQGKTWFALKNLESLGKQFDAILYINLELSIDDIKNRCNDMGIKIPSNLYVSPLDNVTVIEEWCEDWGSVCFIIDNIDNLVGGGNDPFGEQLDFIKSLDRFLKDFGHHALVLTQLVKDNNMNLFGKDGEINDCITTNILSGVKQLSYLSRTVMMTAYSPEMERYVYKILKVGSAKNV